MPAIVRNVTYKASSTLRHWFHSYVTENQVDVHNVDSQIRIESIYNQYVNSFDMHVFKPKSNTFFHGIEIHPVVEFALPRRLSVPRSTVFASPSWLPFFLLLPLPTLSATVITLLTTFQLIEFVQACAWLERRASIPLTSSSTTPPSLNATRFLSRIAPAATRWPSWRVRKRTTR